MRVFAMFSWQIKNKILSLQKERPHNIDLKQTKNEWKLSFALILI